MLSTLLKKTNSIIVKNKFVISGEVYTEDALIGEGAYAYVYRVKDSSGNSFALKKLICQNEDQIKETKKEINLLSIIKHTNVLSLLNSSFHINSKKQTEAFLLLPLYGKSTQDIIDQGPGYPHCAFESKASVLKILKQCIEALKAIHDCGFTHCDFKPANVLLDGDMNAIVTDFGSAASLSTVIGSRSEALSMQEHAADNTTASFRAPELFDTPSQCTIDGKIDVWGLGCTLYALMFSRTPFENPAEGGLSVLAVLSSSFTIPETAISEWPQEYHTLIKASLRTDFTARLSIEELQILASMLPDPDVTSVISPVGETFGSPVGFDGLDTSDSNVENLFANSPMSSAPEGTEENFAHFEDFGDFESNTSTVFKATSTSTSGKVSRKTKKGKTAPTPPSAPVPEISQLKVDDEEKITQDTSEDCGNNNNNNDDINDDDSDFGDFVQAEIEPVATTKPNRNVSMSGEAYIMKNARTGPFRTKSDVKKKVKVIMDNTWFCIKKLEGHPGKIYFEGCVTEDSQIEEVQSHSTLGSFVIKVRNLEMPDESRSSLTQSQDEMDENGKKKDEKDTATSNDNDTSCVPGSTIDIGFDTSQDMMLWCKALQEQVSFCGE